MLDFSDEGFLRRLRNERLERIHAHFPGLIDVGFLNLRSDELEVYCNAQFAEGLKEPEIASTIYRVTGVHWLSAWVGKQETWRVRLPDYFREDIQSDKREVEDDRPMVAVLEKTTEATENNLPEKEKSRPVAAKPLPGQKLKSIAEDTGRSIEAVRKFFVDAKMPIIFFAGDEVVSGEDAAKCYRHFEDLILQAMAKRGLMAEGAIAAQANGNGATAAKPAAKTTQRKTTAAKPKSIRKASPSTGA